MHRRKPSRSVKKKSPTSASRRSISSTRKMPEAACRSPGVVAAGAAAAEVAARAGVAGVAAVAAAAAAAAAPPGARAVGAEPTWLAGFALIQRHGRDRRGRPGHFMCCPQRRLSVAVEPIFDITHDAGLTPSRQIPLAGESILRRRSAATGKMRILIS